MRIETVTPKETYRVVSSCGQTTAEFHPGDTMSVVRTRETEIGDILSVTSNGIEFDIPRSKVYVMNELALA